MDHVWDGFYSGQKRFQRFPALIQGSKGSVYDLNFTGTPSKTFKFDIFTNEDEVGSTIRIAYPGAESRAVYVDGKMV